jgi:hypothetical protein
MHPTLKAIFNQTLQPKHSWTENHKTFVLLEDGIKKILSLHEVSIETNISFTEIISIELKKKVERVFRYNNNTYLIDKSGDIYLLNFDASIPNEQRAVMQNNTFSQITCCLEIPEKKCLFMIDEYYKIKVFNLDNFEEILKIQTFRKIYIRNMFYLNGKLIFFFEDWKILCVDFDTFWNLEDEEDLNQFIIEMPTDMLTICENETRDFPFLLDIRVLSCDDRLINFLGIDNYKKLEFITFSYNMETKSVCLLNRKCQVTHNTFMSKGDNSLKKVKTDLQDKNEKVIVDNTWRKDFKDRYYFMKKAGSVIKLEETIPCLVIKEKKFYCFSDSGCNQF